MKRIAISIAAGLVPYLVAAFYAWDFNAANYVAEGRLAISLLGIWCSGSTYALLGVDK